MICTRQKDHVQSMAKILLAKHIYLSFIHSLGVNKQICSII